MALPVGVTTATITFGVPVSFTGSFVRSTVSVVPSATLIHAATGTPLINFLEDVVLTEGTAGQFVLPHTDQTGFVDESGNSYQNWYYTATITYSTNKGTLPARTKVFQLPTGQTVVDLDLIPVGAPVLPFTAPTANVTSFHGRIGAVTVQDSDLPSRLSDASLNATYASKPDNGGKPIGKGELVLNVRDYGATGDGTTDDTVSIQAAVNAAPAGAAIFFPAGTYLCRRIVGTGKSNLTIYGVRGASVLLYNRTGAGSVDPIIGWNLTANPATNDRNIVIRDLTFKGAGTLSENQALLHMSAIDGLTVNNCEFLNMQGDGINIARTGAGGTDTGVRNRNVRITNNLFDGVNYAGRNGVSIIAGEDVLIQGNLFTRLASPTMPGAIDVEPNVFDTTAICSDIRIVNNTFKDCGGNAADVGVSLVPATFTSKRWEVAGNTFSGSKAAAFKFEWHSHAATDADPYIDINIHDNIISAPDAANTGPACLLEGLRGVRLERNTFTAWPGEIVRMGYDNTRTVKDVSIRGNIIVDGGTTPGYAINWNVGDRVEINDNTIVKSGTVQSALILVGGTGPTSGMIARNNVGRNVNTLLSFGAGTTTASTNRSIGNTGFTSTVPDPVTYFGNVDRIGPLPTTTVTVNYTMNRSDSVIIANGASITVTLPDPTLVSKDRKYAVKNVNSTALTVVSAGTSKTIDGAASQSLAQWAKGTYLSDGTQWLTV